ncbi:MAG: HD-GYP domain-containing protein [Solirubrobacteraceae bacterium]
MIGRRAPGPGTEHDLRVCRYAERLARLAGLDRRSCLELAQASRLHDIGKVTVPADVLDKPGPLDALERALVEAHAEFGHHLLFSPHDRFMMLAARIAWTHHERWDGTGYPRRLRGEQIPLEGRIVAICDVFDALTSDRVYRAALPREEAVAHIRAGGASAFDPRLVDLFLASAGAFVGGAGDDCEQSGGDEHAGGGDHAGGEVLIFPAARRASA